MSAAANSATGERERIGEPALALIDLRNSAAYAGGHHAGATHLPSADLVLRRHELPAPGALLRLCHDDGAALTAAATQLADWGYRISDCLLIDAALLANWQQQDCLEAGNKTRQLWSPSTTLALALDRFADPQPSNRRALDLACGSGRDALQLAQRGYRVVAVDYKPDALERLSASTTAAGLDIRLRCLDLEATGTDLATDPDFDSVALISVVRYLHRPLLAQLPIWLSPGGLLVYETFVRGAERFGGPRRPAFLLEPGELAQRFSGWQILHDVIAPLPDGRPVQQFIARKPTERS